MWKRMVFTAALVLGASSLAFAGPEQGKIGLGVRFATTNTGLHQDFGMQPDLILAYWATDNLVLEPRLGLASGGAGSDSDFDMDTGLALDYYLGYGGPVSPYVGISCDLRYFSPDVGDSQTDFGMGLALGTEYFVSDSFSITGEWSFNLLIADDTGTPHDGYVNDQTTYNTGVGLTARFYVR